MQRRRRRCVQMKQFASAEPVPRRAVGRATPAAAPLRHGCVSSYISAGPSGSPLSSVSSSAGRSTASGDCGGIDAAGVAPARANGFPPGAGSCSLRALRRRRQAGMRSADMSCASTAIARQPLVPRSMPKRAEGQAWCGEPRTARQSGGRASRQPDRPVGVHVSLRCSATTGVDARR